MTALLVGLTLMVGVVRGKGGLDRSWLSETV